MRFAVSSVDRLFVNASVSAYAPGFAGRDLLWQRAGLLAERGSEAGGGGGIVQGGVGLRRVKGGNDQIFLFQVPEQPTRPQITSLFARASSAGESLCRLPSADAAWYPQI